MVKGSQIAPVIAEGFDGKNGASPSIAVAIIEADNFNDEHPGFKTAATGSRIVARRQCTIISCSPVPGNNFGAPADVVFPHHSTAVAGLIFGDLRDGQDPLVTIPNDRIKRSGYAGEANGELYRIVASSAALMMAFDDLISLPRELVNNSVANSKVTSPVPDDPSCLGQSPLNLAANEMYEAGITLVQSGGNDGHTSTTQCMVSAPGAAIGVFTVGSHGTTAAGAESDVRSGAISTNSPRGGTSSQGANRTTIDLTAFSARSLMFDKYGGYTYTAQGASFAAPTVTAAAINFLDFYRQKNAGSVFMEDPGARHVNMLLMGDRTDEVGARMTVRYSNLFGAGRLKMRIKTNANMDYPSDWKVGQVCIGHNEVFQVKINSGNALLGTVDDLKIAIFWYDSRHQKGVAIDNVDLRLRTMAGVSVLSSLSTADNKERIFYNAAGNKALKFEIIGTNVTSDEAGCGTNKMLVYWSYFYEDDFRDDVDGPLASVVNPE